MHYRMLFYDQRHRLVGRFEFAAPTDNEAQEAARDLAGSDFCELWRGPLLIASWRTPQSSNED
jgi:hypothetical protein